MSGQGGEREAATRVTTVRMTEEQAVEVEIVARVLGISVSELIRTAIAEYLTERKSEVEFRLRLARRIDQDRRILDRLSVECNCCCDRTTARRVVCPAHPDADRLSRVLQERPAAGMGHRRGVKAQTHERSERAA